MEAFFGAIASVMIIKEVLTLKMLLGGVMIIFALVVSETKLDFIFKNNLKNQINT